jgi:hypothetical protein
MNASYDQFGSVVGLRGTLLNPVLISSGSGLCIPSHNLAFRKGKRESLALKMPDAAGDLGLGGVSGCGYRREWEIEKWTLGFCEGMGILLLRWWGAGLNAQTRQRKEAKGKRVYRVWR